MKCKYTRFLSSQGHSCIEKAAMISMVKIRLLDTDEDDMLQAEVEGVLKFHGIPGRVKGNKAFQVVKEEPVKMA